MLHEPLPGRLDHGDLLALGGPVEEVPVIGHLLLEPRPAPGGVAEPLEPGGPPVGAVHRGERVDAAPPHALLLLGRGLDDPALHGVGDVVRGDQALDVVHGEEGHAEVLGVLLVPPEPGERDRRASVGQGAHGPVLGGELGVEEEQVLGRRHPDDQAPLLAAGRAGAAEDRLVGEPVGAGGLDVEDLGTRPVGRLGGQPARQRMAATSSGSRWLMSGTGRHSTDGEARAEAREPGPGGRPRRVASPGVLIVIDLSEAERAPCASPTSSPASPWPSRATGDLAQVVQQSGLGRLGADGEHVVVDPVALRALAGPAADDALGRGLRRHVRVRRRKGLGGGRRRRPRPYRAHATATG